MGEQAESASGFSVFMLISTFSLTRQCLTSSAILIHVFAVFWKEFSSHTHTTRRTPEHEI